MADPSEMVAKVRVESEDLGQTWRFRISVETPRGESAIVHITEKSDGCWSDRELAAKEAIVAARRLLRKARHRATPAGRDLSFTVKHLPASPLDDDKVDL